MRRGVVAVRGSIGLRAGRAQRGLSLRASGKRHARATSVDSRGLIVLAPAVGVLDEVSPQRGTPWGIVQREDRCEPPRICDRSSAMVAARVRLARIARTRMVSREIPTIATSVTITATIKKVSGSERSRRRKRSSRSRQSTGRGRRTPSVASRGNSDARAHP